MYHIRLPYLLAAMGIFVVEVLIAGYVNDPIIRGFVGDVLAVVLLFVALKTFLNVSDRKLISGVVAFAGLIEGAQYFHLVDLLGITTPWLRTILGATADRRDLIAYLLGAVICRCITAPNQMRYLRRFFLILLRASLFAGCFFGALIFGKRITTFGLPMYDFLFLAVIVIQAGLLIAKLETRDELKIIMIYHALGFVMELFKTHPAIGSRSYPGDGFFTIATVPLFSGFMYSAIGSFIFQAWRLLQLKFTHFPPFRRTIPIAVLIYVNFFMHHFVPDIRYILLVAIIIVAWRTRVWFRIGGVVRSMHVLFGLLCTGICIRIAENIATYFQVWIYPNQYYGRHLVSIHKILSRFLLFIVSFVIVAWRKRNEIK